MGLRDRYTTSKTLDSREGGGSTLEPRWGSIVRDGLIILACLLFLPKIWPQLPQNVYAGDPIPFLNVAK